MSLNRFVALVGVLPLALSAVACSTSDAPSHHPGKGTDSGTPIGADAGADATSPPSSPDGASAPSSPDATAPGTSPDAGAPPSADGGPVTNDSGSDARPVIECPDAGGDTTDTDGDGIPNACDPDDDNDGFPDDADPAPLDATRPGDFSTPEKILADSRIKAALAAIRAKGIDFPTHTETDPPDVSGLYNQAVGSISFTATGNGENVGQVSPAGWEFRAVARSGNRYDQAGVLYESGRRFSTSTETGALLRGTGNVFTVYSLGKDVCEFGSSPYTEYTISISSAAQEANGNWTNQSNLQVTVATDGTYSSPCNLGGDSELEDGWEATATTLTTKITVDQIQFMCRGDTSAYISDETWKESGNVECSCSATYQKTCTP
jgi:hypothetical protein